MDLSFIYGFYLLIIVGLVVNVILMILMVLLSVAFLTLLERRILGYCHLRKGPNKVGYVGIMQPFGDVIKLFTREYFNSFVRNFYVFYLRPIFGLFLIIGVWLLVPVEGG